MLHKHTCFFHMQHTHMAVLLTTAPSEYSRTHQLCWALLEWGGDVGSRGSFVVRVWKLLAPAVQRWMDTCCQKGTGLPRPTFVLFHLKVGMKEKRE